MAIRMARLLGGIVLVSALFHLPAPSAVATPLPRNPNLRTYRFTARITDNGGVTPFTVGKVITGTFTYDLKGKIFSNGVDYGSYASIRNSAAIVDLATSCAQASTTLSQLLKIPGSS
jgi:hypothetical protein